MPGEHGHSRPEGHRGERVDALAVASRFTRLFGVFAGTLVADDGEAMRPDGCPGFAEDHFARR